MSARARQYLQIEQVKAMELAAGPPPLADQPAPRADFVDWLFERSERLADLHHWRAALRAPAERYRWASLGLAGVLLLLGIGTAARAVAGVGEVLNIFWILGVMLGANLLSLLLWLVLTALGGGGGPIARMLAPLVRRLMPTGSSAQVASNRAWLERRLAPGPGVFRLGAATHLAWLGYALGGLLGLLVLLATRQFDFVWQSTLLGEGSFRWLTRTLGAPLAALGLTVPDAAAIGLNSVPLTAAEAEAVRREWGVFLLGAVTFYGVVPRLLAYGICQLLALRADARLTLDLTDPYYLKLQQSLWPRQRAPRIVDPEAPAATAAPKAVPTPSPAPVVIPTSHHAAAAASEPTTAPRHEPAGMAWLGVELGRQIAWPPQEAAADAVLGNMVDSHSRQAALEQLAHLKGRPLTVVVDADKPADRGMLRQLRQILALSPAERTYLMLVAHREVSRSKRDDWARAVAELGFSPTHVLTEAPHLEALP